MKIATILFTYNRSRHTKKVLDALRNNTMKPDMLYIFQDGLKEEKHQVEWKRVNKLIKEISWCNCEVVVSEVNKGLAKSIVTGINYVHESHDAVIVLEDDCVPHPLFLAYMYSALEVYEHEKQVYSIGGYKWAVDVAENGTDVYFTRRASSWGWATWKDRWAFFEEDYKILGRIKKSEQLAREFHIWGEDLESYLTGNVYGRCDSWATFWALKIIEKNGYCVAPYYSLIENIGFDGSGVHCGTNKQETRMLDMNVRKEFVFCNDYSIAEQTENLFANYFSWTSLAEKKSMYNRILVQWLQLHFKKKTINDYFEKKDIRSICIWGKGDICDLFLQELNDIYSVLAIVESAPKTDMYKGISIVSPKEIPNETQIIVLIPEYDYDKIAGIVGEAWKNKIVCLSAILSDVI